jgi:hypothetical protein
MVESGRRLRLNFVAIAALATLCWCLIGLTYASLAPPRDVPRFFNDHHVEHLAVFYGLALLTFAGLPRAKPLWIAFALGGVGAAFGAIRLMLPYKGFDPEDLLWDFGGILAASAPLAVARFRELSR